jgi:hypothetical protein
MKLAVVLLALLPAPAFAAFECAIERQCGGGTCEAFDGGPMTLRETGDVWEVSLAGSTWNGYSTTTVESGETSIVIPPEDGMSGLVSVYPSGETAFTVHMGGAEGMVVITGTGTCAVVE